MSEDELKALTDLEIRNAVGYYGDKLAEQRRKAQWYYLGIPKGDLAPPEVDGRSTVVDTFVRNTIEAMLPQLMVKFTGGDSVVEFEAQKQGDEGKAKNCTDYLNYLFWKKNRGHTIAETWMRDALLQKNGILKVWWDTRQEDKKEEYKGLTEIELAEIMDDEEVTVTEQVSYPDPEDQKARSKATEQLQAQLTQLTAVAHQIAKGIKAGQQTPPQAAGMLQQKQALEQQLAQIEQTPPVVLYDITAVRSKKDGKLALENVPPEEFLISRKAKSIATAPFCAHRVARTISELTSMGYKNLDDLSGDDGAESLNAERIERLSYDDEQAYIQFNDPPGDDSQRQVYVTECYIRCDWDGDGIAELRKVTRAGNRLLDNEEVDIAPFVDIVCVRQPHKFAGLSIADLGMETQKTKTSILRSQLDNMFLQVNGRYFAVENQVNLDDLLTSRPGGVVRIKQAGAVGRLDQAMGDAQAGMGMLEYMEGFGESATGWTRYSQGNMAGKLGQSTATGMNIIANRDDMRVDLIARNFAEGFVELFRLMLKLVCQHQNKKAEIRLSGDWVDIDPREWMNQFDVNINVALGTGGKEQQIQQVMAVIQQQEKVSVMGVATPENIYQASCELAKLTGQKNGDKFFTDPAKNPPPQKQDPEMLKGQIQMQIEQSKGQATAQMEQMKAQATMQIEREKMQMQAQVDSNEQAAQQAQATAQQELQAQVDTHKASLDAAIKEADRNHALMMEQMRQEAEDRRKRMDNDTKILIAQIQAQAASQPAAVEAQDTADKDLASGKVLEALANTQQMLQMMAQTLTRPRVIQRGPDGRAIGIQ